MLRIFRSSTRMRSKRRASLVEVCSTQSLRRSDWRAFIRPIAALTRLRRIDPPPRVPASAAAAAGALPRSHAGPAPTTDLPRTERPRRPHHDPRRRPVPYPARRSVAGSPRTRRASGPPDPGSPGTTLPRWERCGTSGTVPSRPSGSSPRPPCGTGAVRPTVGCAAQRYGSPHERPPYVRWAAGASGRRSSPWPGRSPAAPALGRARAQAGTACQHANHHHRHSKEGAAFPPRPEARVSTPRSR
jgi:hypothetical protein